MTSEGFQKFAQPLAFTLLIGAAMEAGTPMQRAQVRTRVFALLPQFRADGDETKIRAVLRDILGVDWQPDGEWKMWIDKLEGG